jgi:hypothetical protein
VIVLLSPGAGREEVEAVLERMRELDLAGTPLAVGSLRLIHVTRGRTRRARHLLADPLVQAIVPTSGPRVRRVGRRFYPFHALCASAAGLLLLGCLVLLAGFFPPGVTRALAPGEVPPAPEWPWFLAPMRGLLALAPASPAWLGPSLLVALGALFLALPLLDRTRGEGPRARAPVLAAGLLVMLLVLALGIAGGSA